MNMLPIQLGLSFLEQSYLKASSHMGCEQVCFFKVYLFHFGCVGSPFMQLGFL